MKFLAMFFVSLMFFATPSSAGQLDLTVNGKVYTQDDLARLPQTTFILNKHSIYWLDETGAYTGPRLKDLLKDAKFKAKILDTWALDDYSNDILYELVEKYNPIIAILKDGMRLTIEDKGPFRIIWPAHVYPYLALVDFRFKWVWMLSKITEK